MAHTNPWLITRCYWIGGALAAIGVIVRLFAKRLSDAFFHGGYQSDFDSLRDRVDGCGLLLAIFGLAIVLLALHHHLRGGSALRERRGF